MKKVTQPKMLALLKRSFIESVQPGSVALRDRILSMDDGFEYLLRNRSSSVSFEGVCKLYNLCTGRDFSPTFETDPDFVAKLAEVHRPSTCLQFIARDVLFELRRALYYTAVYFSCVMPLM
jgi:hypothetical protein